MTWIATPEESSATGAVAAVLAAERTDDGRVQNAALVFAQRPEVHAAWDALNAAVKSAMDPRRYELATVAAAVRLRSSYCALAHGRVLAERHLGRQAVVDLVRDPQAAGLPPTEVAVVELARRVAAGAADRIEADVARARAAGLSDPEIRPIDSDGS